MRSHAHASTTPNQQVKDERMQAAVALVQIGGAPDGKHRSKPADVTVSTDTMVSTEPLLVRICLLPCLVRAFQQRGWA